MSEKHDEYKRLDTPDGLEPCPCCGADAELWQHSESVTAPTEKAVMCANGERFGPQDGSINEGCPLYMPGQGHYQPTIKAAVKYWNEFAKALTAQQRKRRWERAQVLRVGAAAQSQEGGK